VREPRAVEAGGESVVGVQGLQPHQRVGDHGDGVGGHERDVVRRAAQGEGVVGQSGQAQGIMRWHSLALVVPLAHLQGGHLLVGRMGDVIGSATLGAGLPVRVLPALVLAVVEGSEGQHVEEEEGRAHGNGDA